VKTQRDANATDEAIHVPSEDELRLRPAVLLLVFLG
jgi:hypothetical protein